MTPDGAGLLCTSQDARIIVFAEGCTENKLAVQKQLIGTNDEIIDVCFTDSSQLAVVSNSEQVRLHSTADMACTMSLVGHTDIVLCVKTSLVATPPSGDSVRLMATGACFADASYCSLLLQPW